MKTLALLFALALPWPGHKEAGQIIVPRNGIATVRFKKIFTKESDQVVCTPKPRAVSKEWAEWQAQPGTLIRWTCK